MFTWFDGYDICDDTGHIIYTVEGELSWGHRLVIYNATRGEIGEIRGEVFTFPPHFRMYMNGSYVGFIEREFTFFKPKYHLSYNDWKIEGNFMAWDYDVISEQDGCIVHTSKEIFHLADTYVLGIRQDGHALLPLMIVLAIDAAKYSGNEQECAIYMFVHKQKSSSQAWQRGADEGSFEGIIEAGRRVLQEGNGH